MKPKVKIILIALNKASSSKTGYKLTGVVRSHALAVLKGYLREKFNDEIRVLLFDTQFHTLDHIIETIKDTEEEKMVIGFSIKPGTFEELLQVTASLQIYKQRPNTYFVFGNRTASVSYDEILTRFPLGYCVLGEGELALEGLIEYILGKRKLAQVPNLAYMVDRDIVVNERQLMDLSIRTDIPEDPEVYYPPNTYTLIESGRGCAGFCTFCSSQNFFGERNIRKFPIKRVIKELKIIQAKGIKSIIFSDDDFIGSDLDHTTKLVQKLCQEQFDFIFRFDCRADDVINFEDSPEQEKRRKHLWDLLNQLGVNVFLGLESGSASQLKRYGKTLSVRNNKETILFLNSKKRIRWWSGWIMFDPLCTLEEIKENIAFLEENPSLLRNINTVIKEMRVQRGTLMENLCKQNGLLKNFLPDFLNYDVMYKDDRIKRVISYISEIYGENQDLPLARINWIISTLRTIKHFNNFKILNDYSLSFKREELSFVKQVVEIVGKAFPLYKEIEFIRQLEQQLIPDLIKELLQFKEDCIILNKNNKDNYFTSNINLLFDLIDAMITHLSRKNAPYLLV